MHTLPVYVAGENTAAESSSSSTDHFLKWLNRVKLRVCVWMTHLLLLLLLLLLLKGDIYSLVQDFPLPGKCRAPTVGQTLVDHAVSAGI